MAEQQQTIAASAIAARLERLPMSRYVWLLVFLAGGAWFVESLDVGASGVVLPVLKTLWHLSPSQIGFLAVASTAGVVVGLPPAGFIGDRIGRVRLLTIGIVIYSALTLLASLSTGYGMLLVLRFLAGLGMGAVFPLPYSIVSEWVQKNRRTWLSGFLDACLSVGYFIAPLLGLLIVPHLPAAWGWRVFLVAAGLPLIYAFLVRRLMPESPRWLASKGRVAEAEASVARAEEASGVTHPKIVMAQRPQETEESPVRVPWTRLIAPTAVSTVAATGTFFMFYVVMTYTPTIFSGIGIPYAKSLGFAALITAVAIPGKLLNGYLSERWGRKRTYGVFMGVAAVAAAFFATGPALAGLVAALLGMSFFGTGAFPGLKMYYAEQYPTGVRVRGAASVEAIGRTLGGIVGAAYMPILWHSAGLGFSFGLIALVSAVAVVVMLAFGQETRGLSLEAIEARYLKGSRRRMMESRPAD
jgi:putative MFS transporter